MIQRVQSFYLLMTSVLSFLFLNGAYLTFFDNSGSGLTLMLTGINKFSGTAEPEKLGGALGILFLGVLIPVVSLVTIFLFKKRDTQIIFTRILILIILMFIVASVVYSANIMSKYNATPDSWYRIIIPFLQLLLSLLALKGIRKDDDLVKSYDRLR